MVIVVVAVVVVMVLACVGAAASAALKPTPPLNPKPLKRCSQQQVSAFVVVLLVSAFFEFTHVQHEPISYNLSKDERDKP